MSHNRILQAIGVACEVIGQEMSPAAMATIAKKLVVWDQELAIKAIERAMEEAKGRISLSDILKHLPDPLGYRGPEESWSAVCVAITDEDRTIFVTDEEMKAIAVAAGPMEAGDKIAARMAYLEAYKKALAQARTNQKKAKYRISPGRDQALREQAIIDAGNNNLISRSQVVDMLPHLTKEELNNGFPEIGSSKKISSMIPDMSSGRKSNGEN